MTDSTKSLAASLTHLRQEMVSVEFPQYTDTDADAHADDADAADTTDTGTDTMGSMGREDIWIK